MNLQTISIPLTKYSTMSGPRHVQITFKAKGHANIRATHQSTIEVTIDPHLTLRGDCIIGVQATQSAQSIARSLGYLLRQPETLVLTQFVLHGITEEVKGFGSPSLTLNDATSLVWRTSTHIDDRTLAIRCNKAAGDLNRQFIQQLQDPRTTLQVVITAFTDST